MESLLILFSYHHKNTEKVANVFAKVFGAQIRTPQQISPEGLQEYGLVGFGSGIYGGRHHKSLLDLADDTMCLLEFISSLLRLAPSHPVLILANPRTLALLAPVGKTVAPAPILAEFASFFDLSTLWAPFRFHRYEPQIPGIDIISRFCAPSTSHPLPTYIYPYKQRTCSK